MIGVFVDLLFCYIYLDKIILVFFTAEWKIISPPIIFGETARLGCEIQNGTDGNTRTWQGGPGYTSIYFNGVSSNPDKYMEVTAREPYRSLLEIYNFSENDVDCDYSCSIGFHEDRHKLSLNPSDFERKFFLVLFTTNKINITIHCQLSLYFFLNTYKIICFHLQEEKK